MPLQAVKPLTYNTRRLQPGDVFEARSKRDLKVLLATKKVREMRPPATVPAPPPAIARQISESVGSDELRDLRARYVAAVGRQPYMGWNADKLRELIAAAKA